MKNRDKKDITNALELIQKLETIEEKEYLLKQIKREILKLEIAIVAMGLVCLSLIVLPFFSNVPFNPLSVIVILTGIALIFKAFREGESLETSKFFLLMIISSQKNKEEDSEK